MFLKLIIWVLPSGSHPRNVDTMRALYPDDQSATADRLHMHAIFLLKLLGKRSSSLASFYLIPPFRYAGVMDGATSAATFHQMMAEWESLLEAESKDRAGEKVNCLGAMTWRLNAVTRLCYLAHEQDLLCRVQLTEQGSGLAISRAICQHFGDSAIVENCHQGAKDIMREARHNMRSRVSKFHAAFHTAALGARLVNQVTVPDWDKVIQKPKQKEFVSMTNPNSFKMQKQCQEIMKYKTANHTWPATSAQSLYDSVCALEWVVAAGPSDAVNSAWLSTFAQTGWIMACRSTSSLCVVLGVGAWAFTSWELEVLPVDDDSTFFKCCQSKTALQFHHMTDLGDWLVVPWVPQLVQNKILFKQAGEPVTVLECLVKDGLTLTVQQCKDLLKFLQVKHPGNLSRAELYGLIIEAVLEPGEARDGALKKSLASPEEDNASESNASDYEDIIDALKETEGNDTDLKKEKLRIGKLRKEQSRRNLLKGKAKAKAKAKGKAKAKAGAKAKAKGKTFFGQRFARKRKIAEADTPLDVGAGNKGESSAPPAELPVALLHLINFFAPPICRVYYLDGQLGLTRTLSPE